MEKPDNRSEELLTNSPVDVLPKSALQGAPVLAASISVTDAHRAADLRLMEHLWFFINSARLRYIIDQIYNRNMDYDYYVKFIDGYLRERELPENHFLLLDLENAFSKFDEALISYDRQMFSHSSVEHIGGSSLIIPGYKLPDVQTNRSVREYSMETRHALEAKYDETLENGEKLLELHAQLVKTIHQMLPEFQFAKHPV